MLRFCLRRFNALQCIAEEMNDSPSKKACGIIVAMESIVKISYMCMVLLPYFLKTETENGNGESPLVFMQKCRELATEFSPAKLKPIHVHSVWS